MTTDSKQTVTSPSLWPRPILLLIFGLVVGLGAGRTLDLAGAISTSKSAANLHLIGEAWRAIQRHFVDRSALEKNGVAYGAISGMVDALGDTGHSTFLTPTMVKRLQEAQRGHLKGIGVEVQMKNGHVTVVAPLDDSPAFQAGLRHGDVILKVDGKDITGLPLSQVVSRITGAPGTSVRLTIEAAHTHRMWEANLTRASIKLKTVTWAPVPGRPVAHLRIASFEERTPGDLRDALTQIQRQQYQALLLDLRNNPGGILDSAVDAASDFLKSGNVLLIKDAQGQIKPVPVEKESLKVELPMVVLINGGSASGAEIVAGAIKDARRAKLLGETTFGTGTVLEEFGLSDGSALLLAVQEWLTPSGHSFWHKGIAPDLTVPLLQDEDILLPEEERTMTPSDLQASGDKQFLAALKLLESSTGARVTGTAKPAQ